MIECTTDGEKCGFQCTSYDGTSGKKIIIEEGENLWKAHDRLDEEGIWCDSCREDERPLRKGFHDMHGLGLGKKAFDKKNWKKFVEKVNCINDSCKEDGRC